MIEPIHALEPLGGSRVDPALMLSLGNPPNDTRKFPQRLPFFRPKEGRDGQWSGPARAFNEKYGVEYAANGDAVKGPKILPIRLPASQVGDVLDIRYLAFGQDRLAARGVTNYAEHPLRFGDAERIKAFPLQGEPVEFDIFGPDDEACLGGHHDIPVDPQGKPSLAVVTTLTFVLAEVGSFTTPVAISTKSRKSRDRIYWKIKLLAQSGSLSHWIMLLAVRPDRVSYRDDQGKRHTAPAFTLDLLGPVASLAERRHLTIDEIQARIDTLADRGLLNTPPSGPAQAPVALAAATASSLPDGAESSELPPVDNFDLSDDDERRIRAQADADEIVDGEVVDD